MYVGVRHVWLSYQNRWPVQLSAINDTEGLAAIVNLHPTCDRNRFLTLGMDLGRSFLGVRLRLLILIVASFHISVR